MNIDDFKKRLVDLSDEEVFTLLDAVSEDVKRRNGMMKHPSIKDIRSQTVAQNVAIVLEALSDLGMKVKEKSR